VRAERSVARYRPGMAGTQTTHDKHVISQIAHAGEDVLRRLLSLPRRIVAGTLDTVGNGLQDAATKLGKVDPLDRRLTALEKRLETLEKPGKAGARTASTRTQPSEQRREPEPAQPGDETNTPSSRTSSKLAG
jgi:hypothetical protein